MKILVVILHDLLMTFLAAYGGLWLRFEEPALRERLPFFNRWVIVFIAIAGLIYYANGLYKSRWRFASVSDLLAIAKAVGVLALGLLILDYILLGEDFFGHYFFGRQLIVIYALLQMALLGAPRMLYRHWKDSHRKPDARNVIASPTLILGRAVEAEFALRTYEAGQLKGISPRGILSPRRDDLSQSIRGVAVLGEIHSLEEVIIRFANEEQPIKRLLLTPSALVPDMHPEKLFAKARKLGLSLSRLEGRNLAPVGIEDLLLRPSVEIDRTRLAAFLKGQRVAVTGGGGSIGAELCRKLAEFGASALLIIENSELALHNISETLQRETPDCTVEGRICDIRNPERLTEILCQFQPDHIFHAAALKHVPYLEQDWQEGILTNIEGSIAVTEASIKAGAKSMVMISTDKAIKPTSILGATKRFAEIYVEARDHALRQSRSKTRLVSVRFGNVLGSNGSVVPKFKAQIEAGGPVTVTDPDMLRYFMTIAEAADLVMTAASHADAHQSGDNSHAAAPSVYVLKMGQEVKILDLATRMIELSGFTPGVDMEITFTGMRPGERLNEILFGDDEPPLEIGLDGVMAAKTRLVDVALINKWRERLQIAIAENNRRGADQVFLEAIPDFKPDIGNS